MSAGNTAPTVTEALSNPVVRDYVEEANALLARVQRKQTLSVVRPDELERLLSVGVNLLHGDRMRDGEGGPDRSRRLAESVCERADVRSLLGVLAARILRHHVGLDEDRFDLQGPDLDALYAAVPRLDDVVDRALNATPDEDFKEALHERLSDVSLTVLDLLRPDEGPALVDAVLSLADEYGLR